MTSSWRKRLSSQRARRAGTYLETVSATAVVERTMLRATDDVPNISSPSLCRDRPIEVLPTLWAFFEKTSVSTMMPPAASRNRNGVPAGSLSEFIM